RRGSGDGCDGATARPIEPTLKFFNSLRAKDVNIAVFFITGRRDKQRQATLWNLDRAGFNGWAGVATRPDDQHGSIVPFRSGERDKVAEKHTILANIGDQDSDLEDLKSKSARARLKVPNSYQFT